MTTTSKSISLWIAALTLLVSISGAASAQQTNEQYFQEQQQRQQQAFHAEEQRRGYEASQDQQEPQPQQPTGRWVEQFGAIATDDAKGVIGAVTGQTSKQEAMNAALQQCQGKGGANCQSKFWYANNCAVMVGGQKRYKIVAADTLDQATQQGISACSAEDSNCHVYYSACSPAQFVRY